MKNNLVGAILAVLSLCGLLAVIGVLCVYEIPEVNRDFFNIALMALVGFVGTAFGYHLGSSDGSAQKNALLGKG